MHDGMEVEWPAPADGFLSFLWLPNANRQFEIVISKWTCVHIEIADILPENWRPWNSADLLDLGLADDSAVYELSAPPKDVIRKAEFAYNLPEQS